MTLYKVDSRKHINIEFIQSIEQVSPNIWCVKTADGCEHIVGPFDSIEDLLADIKKKSIRV